MLNGIAVKAIVPITLAVTGFVILGCLLLHSFNKTDLISDTIRHEAGLADTIVKSTRYAMLKTDREMLQQSIHDIAGQEGVEHVRIFNKKGIVMFSSDPDEINQAVDKKTAGCNVCHNSPEPVTRLGTMEQARRFTNGHGSEVLAITTPIYNEPSCAAASCHGPVDQSEILGTLDIGFSTAQLQTSLTQLRLRLIVFCTMVLFLTVGGVCALLRRNVLLPVRQLVIFAEGVAGGKVDMKAPEGIEEINSVVAVLRRQAMDLQQLRGAQGEIGKTRQD
jgi:sensor histidine kinase regulating citrate/malate metabolism